MFPSSAHHHFPKKKKKKPVFPLQTHVPAVPGCGPQARWGQKGTGSLRSDAGEQETCPQLPLP